MLKMNGENFITNLNKQATIPEFITDLLLKLVKPSTLVDSVNHRLLARRQRLHLWRFPRGSCGHHLIYTPRNTSLIAPVDAYIFKTAIKKRTRRWETFNAKPLENFHSRAFTPLREVAANQ